MDALTRYLAAERDMMEALRTQGLDACLEAIGAFNRLVGPELEVDEVPELVEDLMESARPYTEPYRARDVLLVRHFTGARELYWAYVTDVVPPPHEGQVAYVQRVGLESTPAGWRVIAAQPPCADCLGTGEAHGACARCAATGWSLKGTRPGDDERLLGEWRFRAPTISPDKEDWQATGGLPYVRRHAPA